MGGRDTPATANITCIQRPPKGSNESGLLQQVVFKCRFYYVGFRRNVGSEQWSLKAVDCEIQVIFDIGFTVLTFIFQLREYRCNITHDIYFFDIPRIFLEQELTKHRYFSNMNAFSAFSAGKRHVL